MRHDSHTVRSLGRSPRETSLGFHVIARPWESYPITAAKKGTVPDASKGEFPFSAASRILVAQRHGIWLVTEVTKSKPPLRLTGLPKFVPSIWN